MLIQRRAFLQGLAGAACTPLFLEAMSAEAATNDELIVVVVGLNGGNDGLNTVVPLKQYNLYNALRSPIGAGNTLAYPKSQLALTAFDSNPAHVASASTEYAFAPAMAAMRELYSTGKLAVINGIGLPNAELAPQSHFAGWSDWSTGKINIDGASIPPGWLGAALANLPSGALGPTASVAGAELVTASAASQGLVVGRPSDFSLSIPYYFPQFQLGQAFQRMLSAAQPNPVAAGARSVTNATLNAVSAMQGFAQLAGDYPTGLSDLGQQLLSITQMIAGKSGIRGFVAVSYGYDTHSGQNDTHPGLVEDLSVSLQQFYAYLHAKKLSSNVLIVTISDFGRTPSANLSLGTDHGSASTAFVLGDMVKGGVYGDYPSLKTFDSTGNLAVNVDFRNMLSDVIQALGGNAKAVLGTTYPKLGFI
jgi:uncharacterized protein (DUF1501 family)